jgi:hypothetical protein
MRASNQVGHQYLAGFRATKMCHYGLRHPSLYSVKRAPLVEKIFVRQEMRVSKPEYSWHSMSIMEGYCGSDMLTSCPDGVGMWAVERPIWNSVSPSMQ